MNLLPEGNSGIIIKSDNQEKSSRFTDLGIITGTKIKCIKRNKGIAAYLVRGCVIALRNEDCESVTVETGENDE